MSYNRHTHHRVESGEAIPTIDEESPLFLRHMSMMGLSERNPDSSTKWYNKLLAHCSYRMFYSILIIFILLTSMMMWMYNGSRRDHGHHDGGGGGILSKMTNRYHRHHNHNHPSIIPIEQAIEEYIEVDNDIYLWYRTWGNQKTGSIPLLFVHGGPGNAIEDYEIHENKHFFDDNIYFVIEVDQRGTGKSQPSVRQHVQNIHYYNNISIDQIVDDYEVIRQSLHIESWIVFGGSFGSTISINYGTRYPERCRSLMLRGIYLDTAEEITTVYSRSAYLNHKHRVTEFDILYDYVIQHSTNEYVPSNPNDAEGILRAYYQLIMKNDEMAMWHWFVFENNLMETDPMNLLDPNTIDVRHIHEARSVAFFETRLWITGSYERPSNLLSRMNQLTTMPIFICQGRRDEVCPPKYARRFADALDDEQAYFSIRFIDSGHEQSDPVMARCLEDMLHSYQHDFVDNQQLLLLDPSLAAASSSSASSEEEEEEEDEQNRE